MDHFKPIEKGAFRPLNSNECRILFVRHPEHTENIALVAETVRLIAQGQKLALAGLEIAGAISSPADRAIAAVYFTKAGMEKGGYTTTDARLADMKAEDPDLVKKLKADAKAAGKEPEDYIFEICQTNENFRKMMFRRGTEGAAALREFAKKFSGKTILSASHGGSRMEIVIAALARRISEKNIPQPEVMLIRGQIAELIFNTETFIINIETGELVEENYLEPME